MKGKGNRKENGKEREREGNKGKRKGKGKEEIKGKRKERERKGKVLPSCICRPVIDILCVLCFQVASATSEAQPVSRVARGTDAVAADPTWRDRSVICEFKQLQD